MRGSASKSTGTVWGPGRGVSLVALSQLVLAAHGSRVLIFLFFIRFPQSVETSCSTR